MSIIYDKKYEHFNKAFKNWDDSRGRYISSKAHYEKVMREEGMISEREARRQGISSKVDRKEFTVNKDTVSLIESVRATKDSKGKIHPTGRQLDALNKRKNKLAKNKGVPQ